MTRAALFSLLGSVLLISACASQAPTHYYSLRALADHGLELSVPGSVSFGITSVSLPSELDRPGLVTETGGSGIKVAAYHIWAGDLDESSARALAGLMAENLGIDQVYVAPWDTRFRPQYQLRADIHRFSGSLGGEVVLEVVWSLTGDAGRQLLHSQRSRFARTADDGSYLAYVNTLNGLLSDFSAEVAQRLVDEVANR